MLKSLHVGFAGAGILAAVALLTCLLAGGHDASAQDGAVAPAGAENVPTVVPELITIDQAQNRIRELQAATNPEDAAGTRLIEVYRQIVARLESAKANQEKAESFRRSLETARLRESLGGGEGSPTTPEPDIPASESTSALLQQRLTQAQADLAGLKMKQIDQACRKHGINIAFPQRDLHIKSADAVIRVARVPSEE